MYGQKNWASVMLFNSFLRFATKKAGFCFAAVQLILFPKTDSTASKFISLERSASWDKT